MFAKIENNVVTEWPIPDIRVLFPHTSFPVPMKEEALPEGYVIVGVDVEPEPGQNQKAVLGALVQKDGKWLQSWDIISLDAEEIRATRNHLLLESDWTQVADAPVDKQAWAAYRQALRDITNQSEFPNNTNWPQKPTT